MGEALFNLGDFLKKPYIAETFVDILLCAVPVWFAVMIGLVIGWSWRPRWTGLVFLGIRSKLRFLWTVPPGFGAHRLWLAFTALSAFSVFRAVWSNFKGKDEKSTPQPPEPPSEVETAAEYGGEGSCESARSSTKTAERDEDIVTQNHLEHLIHLLEGKNGEMEWQSMMERSTPSMSYQAWRHDPETGCTIYRSRTVFEDATPELVRDFFWDDEFRPKWDPMLAHCKILEECADTGTMIIHWIKKFPFFCSDREYIIGRRIWEAGKVGKAYYCVTKAVPYPSLPKREKPRRIELYFSSWIIKAVESRKGDGQLSACEVILLHYENMGIPKDVAKLGVRHGMWGAVKKLHSGFRAYQNARKSETSLSRCAQMARITTEISSEDIMDSLEAVIEENVLAVGNKRHRDAGIDWKWLVIGGTLALVCGLHGGAIGKAFLLGAGKRIARR